MVMYSTLPKHSHITLYLIATHTAEVFVEQLHISVNDLQREQLIVSLVNGTAEVQGGIPGIKYIYIYIYIYCLCWVQT